MNNEFTQVVFRHVNVIPNINVHPGDSTPTGDHAQFAINRNLLVKNNISFQCTDNNSNETS